MKQDFNFDFSQLSFEDQKAIYRHIDPDCIKPESLNQASDLEQLMACYDAEDNILVYRLSYLTALLTQEAAILRLASEKQNDKNLNFLEVLYRKGFDFGDDFPIEWYDGFNSDGKGLISLVDTIEMYGLEDLRSIFQKIDFNQS